MRITKSQINQYNRLFATLGGNLTSVDEDAGVCVLEFNDISRLDSFVKTINADPVASKLANFDIVMLDGRGILTITMLGDS
jgi:hypothetical protein